MHAMLPRVWWKKKTENIFEISTLLSFQWGNPE